MTDEERAAFYLGLAATRREDNPYSPGTNLWQHWLDGYYKSYWERAK